MTEYVLLSDFLSLFFSLPHRSRSRLSERHETLSNDWKWVTLHYITNYLYSGLSKSNLKDHYGDAATQQCLGMIAEINEFSVSDEMLWEMGQTGHRQVNCSRVVGQSCNFRMRIDKDPYRTPLKFGAKDVHFHSFCDPSATNSSAFPSMLQGVTEIGASVCGQFYQYARAHMANPSSVFSNWNSYELTFGVWVDHVTY